MSSMSPHSIRRGYRKGGCPSAGGVGEKCRRRCWLAPSATSAVVPVSGMSQIILARKISFDGQKLKAVWAQAPRVGSNLGLDMPKRPQKQSKQTKTVIPLVTYLGFNEYRLRLGCRWSNGEIGVFEVMIQRHCQMNSNNVG